ncbi:MAG TPA: hypothetical protein VMU84_11590 [Thermoanaerobaculia bacterium]|nr:hypothetical protein [Thermoanaerobaculia bacterium]
MKNFTLIILLSLAVRAEAANMARVIEVRDDATIVVDRNGIRANVRLAGVVITDIVSARNLLRWTIGTSWVMVEGDAVAGVYRSPDALFVNRELVLRGYARATSPDTEAHRPMAVTYLGQLDLGPRDRVTNDVVQSAPAPRTSKSTSPRSRASRRRAK